jgi:pyridinium-3,5-bisthiocarboxylic acid mononucleotide nickel chelatase
MTIAYLDCFSGISGDMTLGALVDLGVELSDLQSAIDSLGIDGLKLRAEVVKKNGFRATQVSVVYVEEKKARHLPDILKLVERSSLKPRPRAIAEAIFSRLASAEAHVHGCEVENVHFHEVGAADSIADIVGVAVGFDILGVEKIYASPVTTGTGTVRIAHGVCSVPAPATEQLLIGVPLAESDIEAELTTPTGAAILAETVCQFGPMPPIVIERVGIGAGQKDLEQRPNVLRIVLGQETEEAEIDLADEEGPTWQIETNLDDTTGEMIGYCVERLRSIAVLDVFTTSVQMKKNRPGVVLTVLCEEADLDLVEQIIFTETTALGIRRWPVDRTVLPRAAYTVQSTLGPVLGKVAQLGDGQIRFSPEYEDCCKLAETKGVALETVYQAAREAFDPGRVNLDNSTE